MKYVLAGLFAVVTALSWDASANTFIGDTVQYEVRSASSVIFGAGSAVVDDEIEFIVDAAVNSGFNNGRIAVDISASSILFRGPTTANTFRYGYQSIRIFSLDFFPSAEIGGIATTVNLADPSDMSVTFGPHEVVLYLGNSLWVPGAGDSIRVDLLPVPELSTTSLFLIGLAAIGAGAWRRKRATSSHELRAGS
jgi:hypothetical protein